MKKKTTGTFVVISLAAVGALFLALFRSVAIEAVYPFERAGVAFSRKVWTRVKGLAAGAEANAENVRLRREIAALTLACGDAARLAEENVRLRHALGYAEREPDAWIPAAVLSGHGGAACAEGVIRADKGARAGVREGAVVMSAGGLVGRVGAVTPHTSEIRLLTDPCVKVACEVVGGPRGILAGGDEDALVLRHLRSAADVPPRSRVLTSGLGGVFPKGLEVGTFLRTNGTGSAIFAEVLPAVDFSALEDVFIRREK